MWRRRILLLLHAALSSCVHSRRKCSQHQLLLKAPFKSPSSARRVSLRAAISTLWFIRRGNLFSLTFLYWSSSLPTRAVLRSDLSEPELSIRVRTFHAPMVRSITFIFIFSYSTAKLDSRWSRLTSQELWSKQLFRAPFLAPSPRAESTSLSHPDLAGSTGKAVSGHLELSPDAVDDHDFFFVLCHALHAPHNAAASPFGLLNHSNDSSAPAAEADFT